MRLVLFGRPALQSDHDALALPAERRSQLLATLALRGAWVARSELAALLWPELPPNLAFANLRKALFRLQSLAGVPPVEHQAGSLRLAAATDVADFERALREGRPADAIALRRGELLEGFDDDSNGPWTDWLRFERDRLRAAWRGAVLKRLGEGIDGDEALDLAGRLLEADPLDEAAVSAQVAWLARGGQGARARQAYAEYAARLERELGIPPGVDLASLLGAAGAEATPPAARPVAVRDDSFVGRSVELRRIAETLLHADCRLLTLIGPGGVGKTRLAQRALQDLSPTYEAGGLFVPLDDLATADEVAQRIVREAGRGPVARGDPVEQAIALLGDRHRLLVLDNFEHLAAAAPLLERLLDGCPRLGILVTSRVRLMQPSEWTLALDGLPCPEREDEDRIEAFDAARLFIAAARRVAPAMVPSREAAAIVEICHQVGGLPLALQLAAAWTRVLSCAEIARELRQGTELLRATDATLPERHASFEVVFDQSWRLLGAPEREALARLSVFRGGFTAEAARTVAGASLPVLAALADKSLVRPEGARMHLHPLVQQLAALRLGDGPDRAATQSAHAAYYHHFLARRSAAVERGDGAALAQVDAEFENVRLAWQAGVAMGREAMLLADARTISDYCDHRARLDDGIALLRLALDSPACRDKPAVRAGLLSFAANLAYRQDRHAEAQATATEALAAARASRDRPAQKKSLSVLASIAMRSGDTARARKLLKQALALAADAERPQVEAGLLDNLATVEKRQGHLDEALRLSVESLAQHRRFGDSAGVALCLNNLGSLSLQRGEHDAALGYLREARVLCERDGLLNTLALVLANLAGLALLRDELGETRAHAERSLQIAESSGLRFLACWLTARLARVAVREGDTAEARRRLATCASLALALGLDAARISVLAALVEYLAAEGEEAAARAALGIGLGLPSLNAPDREELNLAARCLRPEGRVPAAPPSLPLDEVLQRIVSEADARFAPLVGSLEGAS